MRSRTNLPVFVAYALLGLLATAFLALQMGGEFVFGGYRVDAIFKSGAELVAGDDVSMSGLRVGKVETLMPLSGATRVTMLLHHDFTPVFKDARAVIRQKNLLQCSNMLSRRQPLSATSFWIASAAAVARRSLP